MERIKKIRNPYQDRINALNAKDIEEGLKSDALLKTSREPIPNDINDDRFPMTDILPPNVLKPEDLSMKDLLDELQIQTILNNNISPFVKKEIKSEVTQAMIDQFKFDSSKPVQIGDTFYKFKPPGVELTLTEVPPPFPNEDEYYAALRSLMKQEIKISKELDRQRDIFNLKFQGKRQQFNEGTISKQEFLASKQNLDRELDKVSVAVLKNSTTLSNLERDMYMYDEYKLDFDTKVDLIKKENKKKLTNYEDEIASRNIGMGMTQQPGESDMDYAQRMIDTAQETVDPDTVEAQAKLFLYTSVKNLMIQLVQPYKAEAILNAIINAGGYEKLQSIKEQFTAIKKKLEDTFGNLANVSTDSIAQVMFDTALKPTLRTPVTPTSTALTTTPTIVPSSIKPPITYSPTQYLRTKREPDMTDLIRSKEFKLYDPASPSFKRVGKKIPEVGLSQLSLPEEELFDIPEEPRASKASPKTPISALMPFSTYQRLQLQRMLEDLGETFQTGNSITSRRNNYDKLVRLGEIPNRIDFISPDNFSQLSNEDMATYLDANEITGTRSGVAFNKLGRGDAKKRLTKQYESFIKKLTMEGKGFKSEHVFNIKDKFAIVDGEIQAGNNNPQLLRDARKMLK